MRDCGMKGVSVVVVVALGLLCGCDRDDQQIKVYKVAKAPLETTPPPEAAMPTNPIPASLMPVCRFDDLHIARGLPEPGPFGLNDLRCCLSHD